MLAYGENKENAREHTIEEIASAMSEMYLKCEQCKANDFIMKYSKTLEDKKNYVQMCKEVIVQIGNGTEQKKLLQKMTHLSDYYGHIQEEISSWKEIGLPPRQNGKLTTYRGGSLELQDEMDRIKEMKKYENFMDLLKEYLQQTMEKLEDMEQKYEASVSKIEKAIHDLYIAFQNEMDIAETRHNKEIKNRLHNREELLDFETWDEEKRQEVFLQIAKLSNVNQVFYQIYQSHIEKFKSVSVSLGERDIRQSMEDFAMSVSHLSVQIQQEDFMGELQLDVAGGLLKFFQGEEAKARYLYHKKYRPQIETALYDAVKQLYKRYEEKIQKNLDVLRVQWELTNASSFEEELGTIEDVRIAKQKIQELLEKNTDFFYKEKNLMDLLFGGEQKRRKLLNSNFSRESLRSIYLRQRHE